MYPSSCPEEQARSASGLKWTSCPVSVHLWGMKRRQNSQNMLLQNLSRVNRSGCETTERDLRYADLTWCTGATGQSDPWLDWLPMPVTVLCPIYILQSTIYILHTRCFFFKWLAFSQSFMISTKFQKTNFYYSRISYVNSRFIKASKK